MYTMYMLLSRTIEEVLMLRSMRIKKVYLEQIKKKFKMVEYRSIKPCYNYLKNPNLKYLIFHYQNPNDRVLVEIKDIKVIPTPLICKQSGIEFTDKVYAIRFEFKKRLRA